MMKNTIDEAANIAIKLMEDEMSSASSAQRNLAKHFASEFVRCDNVSSAVERVKTIIGKMREIIGKDEWKKKRSTSVSMIYRVLSLSGAIVAKEWAEGKFGEYPIQATYRALVSKYDAKGKRKVEKPAKEIILKSFVRLAKKYGAENVVEVFGVYMSRDDSDTSSEVNEVIASINPFEGMATR